MPEEYTTKSTSNNTSAVEDIVISTTTTTRRVLRAEIIDKNPKDPEAGISATIVHQRKKQKDDWEDIKVEPLSTLKSGEMMKLNLSSVETLKFYRHLQDLYAIHGFKGPVYGESKFLVGFEDEMVRVDSTRAQIIKKLVEKNHSEELWNQLVENDPDLATQLSHSRLYQSRKSSLDQFEIMLGAEHTESEWQNFFDQNKWIFGYGLNYQILKSVTSQPSYGGQKFDGTGQNRGDYLMASEAAIRFTALVEIKKPQTELLEKKPYRNGVHSPGEDLNGGIAQLRCNAYRWQVEGSTTQGNIDELESKSIYTVQPKKILVIGNTEQLNDRSKRESFDLFANSQVDIEIICFDELFERAKFILDHNGDSKDISK